MPPPVPPPEARLRRLAARCLRDVPCRLVLARRAYPEQRYFELWPEPGTPARHPVLAGVYSVGRPKQGIAGWLDVDYCDRVALSDGTALDLSAGLDRRLFRSLRRLVPPNGKLMVAYEMFAHEGESHRQTQLELLRGVPPLATPLGALLHVAGCWLNIRDWYIAEGGREGPRKLQGNRALDAGHLARRAAEAQAQLAAFLASDTARADTVLAPARRRAQRLLAVLRRRFPGEQML